MKGWSNLFFVLFIILIILSVISIAGGIVPALGCLVSALSCLFFHHLCGCVTEILDNQKKLLIMVDNLKED
jgi:FtsH-binding integral membrane protein